MQEKINQQGNVENRKSVFQVEIETAVEIAPTEIEYSEIEGIRPEGYESAQGLGAACKQGEGEASHENDGGKYVGYEYRLETFAGTHAHSDFVAHMVFLSAGSTHRDDHVFLFGQSTIGPRRTRGTTAEACYAHLHFAGKDSHHRAGVSFTFATRAAFCYLHDLGAFLQFFTQRPLVSILWISPL